MKVLLTSNPPTADAPLKVIESPAINWWAASVTVTVALPLFVANGLLANVPVSVPLIVPGAPSRLTISALKSIYSA